MAGCLGSGASGFRAEARLLQGNGFPSTRVSQCCVEQQPEACEVKNRLLAQLQVWSVAEAVSCPWDVTNAGFQALRRSTDRSAHPSSTIYEAEAGKHRVKFQKGTVKTQWQLDAAENSGCSCSCRAGCALGTARRHC